MLKLLSTWARVAFGFVLASIAAGLVTVLFVNTPADVMSLPMSKLPETVSETIDLALLTATHAALFAVAFVMIVAGLGEWFSIRAMSFYVVAGIIIAALGFAAQYSSEVAGQPTIFNGYAMTAFITTGLAAGFVYWLASGQFAGVPRDTDATVAAEPLVVVDDDPPPAAVEVREEPELERATPTVGRPSILDTARSHYTSLHRSLRSRLRSRAKSPDPDPLEDALRPVDDDEVTSVIVKRPGRTQDPNKPSTDDEPEA